jgi:hypothetical protein
MPIQSPILDDRTYQQIREDLIRRIPVFTPEWTDFNESDPGVTLLDLVAFQAENLLFRFNQIPDTTKLEFLRLLRISMRPAQPARGLVAFTTKELPGQPGEQIVDQGTEVRAGKVAFETEQEVSVWPVSVQAIARAESPAPDDGESLAYAIRSIDARGGLADNERAVYYTNQVVPSEPEAPGAVPVDFRSAVDGMLWIAVMGDPGVEQQVLGQILDLGVALDEVVSGADALIQCAGDLAQTRSLPLEWQVSTGRMAGDRPVYRTLSCVGDTTRGLRDGGVVRLRLPRDAKDLGAFPLPDPDLAGTGDLPPEIDDEDQAKKVRFWIRAFRPRGGGSIGRVAWLGVNASQVVQTSHAANEFVGTGDAQASQQYPLVHRSVVASSLRVQVEEQGNWTTWQVVDDFHASTAADRHVVLDAEAGEIRFGTGVQGRVPQIGERIRTLGYRFGGGLQGNVPAKGIDKVGNRPADARPIRRIDVKVANPMALRGGADSESLRDALDRVPGELRRRDRAVTRGDFRELALATPGAGVGRSEVLPRFHPPTRQLEAAGVVTVVIWPREDRRAPNAPMPDRTLISQVCEWLDSRRLVTTELYVVPPVYRKVAVAVGVKVKPGYGIEAVRNWVELVVRQYLAPLPPYGPEGGGWPLGRRVHAPELEAAALQVEGVEYLEGLTVAGMAPEGGIWVPGTVTLELDEVPELAEITVVEGPPLVPGVPLEPPDTGKVAVPIRVAKEGC